VLAPGPPTLSPTFHLIKQTPTPIGSCRAVLASAPAVGTSRSIWSARHLRAKENRRLQVQAAAKVALWENAGQ